MSTDDTSNQPGQTVGARIRAARLAQKFTQSQLASPDFSVSYISAIERGQIQPSLRALAILARRLNLSPTQLLSAHGQNGSNFFPGGRLVVDSEAEVEWTLLEAQVLLRQGEPADQVIARLEKLIPKDLKRRQQILRLYLLGWAYLNTEQLHDAAGTLFEASEVAEDLKDRHLRAQIHNLLGTAYARLHNYQEAVQSNLRCVKLLENEEPHDPLLLVRIYTDLGQYYLCQSNTEKAIEMFRRAITILEEVPSPQHLQVSYWKICEQAAHAKEYEVARSYAYRWSYLQVQEHLGSSVRGELYHYLGRVMLKGDKEQARIFLDEAVQQLSALQDQLALASVTTHLAVWLFEHETPEKAAKHAQKAHGMAKPFGDTLIAADTELTLGRIAYARSSYNEGDRHFQAGLDMLERLEMLEELAEESAHYAQLLEKQGKDTEALSHYKRAFEIRRKVGRGM